MCDSYFSLETGAARVPFRTSETAFPHCSRKLKIKSCKQASVYEWKYTWIKEDPGYRL